MIGNRLRTRGPLLFTGQTTAAQRPAAAIRGAFMWISSKSTFFLFCMVPLAVACQRKAPGPEECHDLAVRWVSTVRWGGGAPVRGGRARVAPDDDAVLERTTRCLTTPYDRELVECVRVRGGAIVDCYEAFEARHGVGLTRQ
jgi:hypothetical protein